MNQGLNRDFQEYLAALGFDPQPWLREGAKQAQSQAQTLTEVATERAAVAAKSVDFEARWSALEKQALSCTQCKLHKTRTNVVFGVGDRQAKLMFVGEGPGADEDAQGEPFVGKAGQLLTKMIQAMGLSRSQVYIANVIKCRPPQNRNPEPDEIEPCSPFLKEQIALVQPDVIVGLGKFASQSLLQTQRPISQIRGRFAPLAQSFKGAVEKNIEVMPTFHPAFLLRSPEMKKEAWDDLKLVMSKMGLAAK